MSLPKEKTITCPNCKQQYEIMIWDSINSFINPEMKPSVQMLRLFHKPCPHCKHDNIIDYPVLYHQMEDKFAIQYMPDKKTLKMFESMPNDVNPLKTFQDDNYIIRLTSHIFDLGEKAIIFDNDLDDRAIEIMKILLLKRLDNDNPELNLLDDVNVTITLDDENNFKPAFLVLRSDGPYARIPFEPFKDSHDGIRKKIEEKFKNIRLDKSMIINVDWAMKNINTILS